MASTTPTVSAAQLVANIDRAREVERKLQIAGPVGGAAATVVEGAVRDYTASVSGSKTFVDDLDRTRQAANVYAYTSPLTGALARPVADAAFIAYQDAAIAMRKPKG